MEEFKYFGHKKPQQPLKVAGVFSTQIQFININFINIKFNQRLGLKKKSVVDVYGHTVSEHVSVCNFIFFQWCICNGDLWSASFTCRIKLVCTKHYCLYRVYSVAEPQRSFCESPSHMLFQAFLLSCIFNQLVMKRFLIK